MSLRRWLGLVVGAILGTPVGELMSRSQPWVADYGYFLAVGVLAGAVCGSVLSGGTLDRVSWTLLLSPITGGLAGGAIPHVKWNRSLEGAIIGFGMGIIVVMIWPTARVKSLAAHPENNSK